MDRTEVAEVGARRARELALQDQRLATPGWIPVLVGIEVEDVRPELLRGIAVRRHLRVRHPHVPGEARGEIGNSKHARDEAAILRAVEFLDEALPRVR